MGKRHPFVRNSATSLLFLTANRYPYTRRFSLLSGAQDAAEAIRIGKMYADQKKGRAIPDEPVAKGVDNVVMIQR